MKDATRAVRSGLTPARAGEPIHAGPVFVSTFHTPGDETGGYSYARAHQPTWTLLERAIGELEVEAESEPAQVRVFASGIAAIAAAIWAVLAPGDTIVVQRGLYFGTRQLLEQIFVPTGVKVRTVAAEEMTETRALEGAQLVWVETPGNPGLEVIDLRALAQAAGAAGARLAVDNTTASPLGQRPLELGADLSVCSDSKAMSGHSDLLLGHVATRNAALLERVDSYRNLGGAIPGPMEAWLALRSLGTLPLRLERMSANALSVASLLACVRGVAEVRYPGLATHEGHEIARGQMARFGPVLSFVLPDREAARTFFASSQLVTETTSFGGITTSAERRARWGGDAVGEGFLRMSVGCEDGADLICDLEHALRRALEGA